LRCSDLIAAKLRDYITPAKSRAAAAAADNVPTAVEAAVTPPTGGEPDSLKQLSSCWLRLLRSGQHADINLVCKEEQTLACHKLVLAARCPLLISHIIDEKSTAASAQAYVIMSDYDSCVVRVLLEFLYGGVFNVGKLSDRQHVDQLRQLANTYQLPALKECLSKLEVTFVEENDDEIDTANKSRGFFDDQENKREEEEGVLLPTGTQNLDALAGLLEDEADQVPAVDDNEHDNDNADDWDEFCVALTQKSRGESNSSDSDSDNEDYDHEDRASNLVSVLRNEDSEEAFLDDNLVAKETRETGTPEQVVDESLQLMTNKVGSPQHTPR
jgi:hypothetical protein